MSFPRYPAYKDSGVEWLGEVPEHWTVISIKWLSPVRRGASPRPIDDPKYFDADGDFSWVRIADVSACDGVLTETTQQLSELGSSLSVKVAPGDLFVSIADTVGKPCLSAIKACIHDGFVYFPTLQIDPKFLYRVFESGTCYGGLGKWGTQPNLNTDTIGSIRIALPPAIELKNVLTFLDHETAKIDALVAEQRRLMELLKEKRQAVISHAVTRGLNPDAPTKPSGVEWLGDVPVRWDVSSFRHCLNHMFNGLTATQVDETAHTVPVTRIETISYGVIDDQKLGFINLEDARADRLLMPGDILFSNINSLNMVGKCAFYAGGRTIYAGMNLLVLRPEVTKCDPLWLCWLVRSASFRCVVESLAKPAINQASISQSSINSITVAVPPIPEQIQIAAFLDSETAKFDTLTAEAQRAIDLLQERRTALISAAVTGQIDVRGAVQRV